MIAWRHELLLLPEEITLEGSLMKNKLFIDGHQVSLAKSLKVCNHSPTGFTWGYGGSGAAQSALGILLDYLPKDTAVFCYQSFKWHFIALLPQTDFIKRINLREIVVNALKQDGIYPPDSPVEEAAQQVIDHLNACTGSNHELKGTRLLMIIADLLKKGYTTQDMMDVATYKNKQWTLPESRECLHPIILYGTYSFRKWAAAAKKAKEKNQNKR